MAAQLVLIQRDAQAMEEKLRGKEHQEEKTRRPLPEEEAGHESPAEEDTPDDTGKEPAEKKPTEKEEPQKKKEPPKKQEQKEPNMQQADIRDCPKEDAAAEINHSKEPAKFKKDAD